MSDATRHERAEKHFREHKYDFDIWFNTGSEDTPAIEIYCTTENTARLWEILERSPGDYTMSCENPEFLGNTINEIEENIE